MTLIYAVPFALSDAEVRTELQSVGLLPKAIGHPGVLAGGNSQEQDRQPQPRTAARPGGSGAAEFLGSRLVGAALNPAGQAVELEAAKDQKHGADYCLREPC